MWKIIVFVVALLIAAILWAVCENYYHRRKHKRKQEKDKPNFHGKREIQFYKGENKPKPEHDWIEFHLN